MLFPLPKDAKRILVVDDRIDYGETFRRCLRNIFERIHPELDAENWSLHMKMPPDMDVRFFAILNSGDAPYRTYYFLYDSLDYAFPWDEPKNQFRNKQFRDEIINSNLWWASQVIEVMDELGKYEPPTLGPFYQNRPLSSEMLLRFSEIPGEVNHIFVLKKEIDTKTFINLCIEQKFFYLGDNQQKITMADTKSNSFIFEVSSDHLAILLKFVPENLRTHDEMCRNCELKDKDGTTNACQTCNSYVRSIEALDRIFFILESECGVNDIKTVIKNPKNPAQQITFERKAIADLRMKNML